MAFPPNQTLREARIRQKIRMAAESRVRVEQHRLRTDALQASARRLLGPLALEIKASLGHSGDQLMASLRTAEAYHLCAASGLSFRDWAVLELGLSYDTAMALVRASKGNTIEVLRYRREATAARMRKHRAKNAAEAEVSK